MWRLMLPKARHVGTLVVFLSLLLAVLYVVARHTDPYEAAERFLLSDVRVSAAVGSVNRVDFKFWEGFHFASSSNGGEANFTFEVAGSRGSSVVDVHLRSASGVWRVVTADLRAPGGDAVRIVGSRFAPSVVGLC